LRARRQIEQKVGPAQRVQRQILHNNNNNNNNNSNNSNNTMKPYKQKFLVTAILGTALLIFSTFGVLGPSLPTVRRSKLSRGARFPLLDSQKVSKKEYSTRNDRNERDDELLRDLVPSIDENVLSVPGVRGDEEEVFVDDDYNETPARKTSDVDVDVVGEKRKRKVEVEGDGNVRAAASVTSKNGENEEDDDLHPHRKRKPRPPPENFTARDEKKQTPPEHALDPAKILAISLDHPRSFLYKRFMTDEECDYLVNHSKNRMSKSGVVDATTGGTAKSDIRTSTGSFIGIGVDDLMKKLETRVATYSMLPVRHQEATQVLRYEIGQEYRAHYDYFFHKGGTKNNRIVTILMYLHDPEFGGETVFPNTAVPRERVDKGWEKNFSDCGNRGRAALPQKGDALIFWSMKPGGELDPGSSHAGCPVIRGEKWTATKWIHVNPTNEWNGNNHKVHYEGGPANSETCKDTQDACAGWAESGECKNNPGFMVNSCKVSCRQCVGGWRDGSYDPPKLD